MEATVKDAPFLGNDASYFVEAGPIRLQAVRTARAELIEEGRKIWLSILPEDCILLGSDGQRIEQQPPCP
jgi:hypothetical protein